MAIKDDFLKVVKDRRFQIVATIVVLLIILIWGAWVRTQNLPLLKDVTTGNWLSSDIDPFYWLRIAKTMLLGPLPVYDTMRYPALHSPWPTEILPAVIVFMYKTANLMGINAPIELIDIVYPVVFFILGLITFFLFVKIISKSKVHALISTSLLAFIPIFLYRSMAGVGDHEPIGFFAFFLTLTFYAFTLKKLNESETNKKNILKLIISFIILGFLTAFTIASWGGIANYLTVIIPLSMGILWLIKSQPFRKEQNFKDVKKNFLLIGALYITWIVVSILSGLLYKNTLSDSVSRIITGGYQIIVPVILIFILIDYLSMLLSTSQKLKISRRYKFIFGAIVFVALLSSFSFLSGKNILQFGFSYLLSLIHPISGRIGTTVAENAQPYLLDLINQVGKIFFWIFMIGVILFGMELSAGIKKGINKIILFSLWAIFLFAVLFSRYSSTSIFNGSSFFSSFVYLFSATLFIGFLVYLYFKDEFKLDTEIAILFAWSVFMLISFRATVRIFFVIAPFICYMAASAPIKIFNYARERKEELSKMLSVIVLVLVIAGLIFSFYTFVNIASAQSKVIGPSADTSWQKAMNWTRNNTPTGAVFIHWWDYGFWVQTLGERATVTDGAHYNSFWDHLVGRYLLTNPNPSSALSFMETQNVSYLLIDSSDIGKYPAYSSIGSDANGSDRFSQIPTFVSNPSQIQETQNGTTRIYQGTTLVDEDIVYGNENGTIFLPASKAFVIGLILKTSSTSGGTILQSPYAVFMYNQKQYQIPIRYVYYRGQIVDFGSGLDVVIDIIPVLSANSQGGIQIDNIGAAIYLSPKTKNSLFAELYLLNDVFNEYPTITLAHSEGDPSISYLNMQGANLPEIIYYNGVMGPIKIWKINYPSNILTKEEFLATNGSYAEFDNLVVTA